MLSHRLGKLAENPPRQAGKVFRHAVPIRFQHAAPQVHYRNQLENQKCKSI